MSTKIWEGTVRELARKVWPEQRQSDDMFNVRASAFTSVHDIPYGLWFEAKVVNSSVLRNPSTHAGDAFSEGQIVMVIRRKPPRGSSLYAHGLFEVRIGSRRANLTADDAVKALEIRSERPDQSELNSQFTREGMFPMSDIRKVVAAYKTKTITAADKPPGSGWEKVLGGKDEHGGMRRKKSEGGYEYWYPSEAHAEAAYTHHAGRAVSSQTVGSRNRHHRHAVGAKSFMKDSGKSVRRRPGEQPPPGYPSR